MKMIALLQLRNKLTLFFLLLGLLGYSQDVDSTREIKKVKFHFAFDARRSKVIDQKAKFNGLTIGVELHEKYRVGLGFHGLGEELRFKGQIDQAKYPDATDTLFFNFAYTTVFYDRIWLRTKRWQISTPYHFGIGGFSIKYQNISGDMRVSFLNGGVFLNSLGGHVQFKIWRWFALGAGYGYRMALIRDDNVTKALNAPYSQFQVKVLLGQLYRMVFKKDQLEPW